MFIQLAEQVEIRLADNSTTSDHSWDTAVDTVFNYRSIDLLDYLEQFWALAAVNWGNMPPTGRTYGAATEGEDKFRRTFAEPAVIGNLPSDVNVRPAISNGNILSDIRDKGFLKYDDYFGQISPSKISFSPSWKHIIYAYAIENTRVLNIFQGVLREIITGERLGKPNTTVLSWARNTEELFFTERLGHWIFSPVSRLREDPEAIRRNAYYRVLGMELNHTREDGRPYLFSKPDAANREFSRTFEQLLRETWRGYINRDNTSGQKQTDNASLFDLVNRLKDMLNDRRIHTALAREEFFSVATLSWFHMTLSGNNKIVEWLQAEGKNAAERLQTIGVRVGIAPHLRAYNFFEMANELSEILMRIETDTFTESNIMSLYCNKNDSGATIPTYSRQMLKIINHWSAATGRNLKDPGLYLPETSFAIAMPRSLIQQGGNGYHSLAKAK